MSPIVREPTNTYGVVDTSDGSGGGAWQGVGGPGAGEGGREGLLTWRRHASGVRLVQMDGFTVGGVNHPPHVCPVMHEVPIQMRTSLQWKIISNVIFFIYCPYVTNPLTNHVNLGIQFSSS